MRTHFKISILPAWPIEDCGGRKLQHLKKGV